MMHWKSVGAVALSLSLVLALASAARPAEPADDRAAVERAVQDYVEALYLVKPELIERSVHPALEKMGMYRPDESGEYRLPGKMTFEQLRDLAKHWNAEGSQGKDIPFEIRVHDVMDVTASAKLSAKWGVDHMHLRKVEGSWKIVQILWQSHPKGA